MNPPLQIPVQKASSRRHTARTFPSHQFDIRRIQFDSGGNCSSEGGYGIVKRALLDPNKPGSPQVVAVKILKLSGSIDRERIQKGLYQRLAREVITLSAVKHPNVLELIGSYLDLNNMTAGIISPWATFGDARVFLWNGPTEGDIRTKLSILYDATQGLAHLHGREPAICHADIKAANVLVTEGEHSAQTRALLGDFGLARLIGDSDFQVFDTSSAFKGSIRWCSPERLNDNNICIAGDVWSWAWLAWELITGTIPFSDIPHAPRVILAIAGQAPCLPNLNQHASFAQLPELRKIMPLCWTADPDSRAQITQCLAAVESEAAHFALQTADINHMGKAISKVGSPLADPNQAPGYFDLTNIIAEEEADQGSVNGKDVPLKWWKRVTAKLDGVRRSLKPLQRLRKGKHLSRSVQFSPLNKAHRDTTTQQVLPSM